ncbi:MAG TPA: 16S rRNA (cytidine(1402)-2'-O)-methyltransferase [Polyangiaceae bacterium]|nr:16S rRNA (cytidine(1402)-2'-O)-methyltransferase [Polyangiaceae bacterium]
MPDEEPTAGRLVVVATPIGNLEDLSPRARGALAAADRVLAEDTRRTRQLLAHLGVEGKPIERLDAEIEHRGPQARARSLERLSDGETLVLVSDAGTPVVSDPGAALVRDAAAAGVRVEPIPGPSAVTTALMVSGLSGERFRFFGFLPRQGPRRREILAEMRQTPETVVFFEAPSRMASTLDELAAPMPAREMVVARELSKVHEEVIRGTVAELAEREGCRAWQGEITIVLGPRMAATTERWDDETLDTRIDELLASGMRAKDVAKALALDSGHKSREIYARIVERRS